MFFRYEPDVLFPAPFEEDTPEAGPSRRPSLSGAGREFLFFGDLESEVRGKFTRGRDVDERWMDPSVEGEKWVRGQQVEDRPAQGGSRRGGRGRGRRRGQRAG